jgi:hypothetical protein
MSRVLKTTLRLRMPEFPCSFWRAPAALAFFAAAGCLDPAELEPAASPKQLDPGSKAAFDESAGVRVIARADAWEFSPNVSRHLTPVRVDLLNRSGQAVSVAHEDITFVGRNVQLRAVPPERAVIIPGASDEPPRTSDDPNDESEVRQAALPERPVENGRSISGFVYFEPVQKEAGPIELQIPVRSSEGTELAVLRIPFVTE